MSLAKKTFEKTNNNTYRGYFPPQPGQQDNLKEGVEIGPKDPLPQHASDRKRKFDLAEPNVWPSDASFKYQRSRLENLYPEIQLLSTHLHPLRLPQPQPKRKKQSCAARPIPIPGFSHYSTKIPQVDSKSSTPKATGSPLPTSLKRSLSTSAICSRR